MEQWTITEPFEGRFQPKINHGGKPFWCMFDYAVSSFSAECGVEIVLASEADEETLLWFPHLQLGMIHRFEKEREYGREFAGIRIMIHKIHTHPIDTTEQGCVFYGCTFVSFLHHHAEPIHKNA